MRSNSYDLILVYTSFRRHGVYLNIVKYMAPTHRIGILRLESDASSLQKVAISDGEFLKACFQYGALEVRGPCHTKLLVLPRMGDHFIDQLREYIQTSITYEKLALLVAGHFSGIYRLPDLVSYFGKAVILAADRQRFGAYEPESVQQATVLGCEVIEVGSPYKRYPIFSNFQTDYLVAYPSSVAVADYRQLYWLLHNYIAVLDSLPKGSVVYTKPHNVKDEGNYLSYAGRYRYKRLPWRLVRLFLRAFHQFVSLRLGRWRLYDGVPLRILREINPLQNAYILGCSRNLLDEYPGFGIEHFMPGVRRGVITGLSATICEALYEKIPTYNIDPLPIETRPPTYQMLYRSYGISTWKGFMTDTAFATIADSARQGDLLEVLKNLVASCMGSPRTVV